MMKKAVSGSSSALRAWKGKGGLMSLFSDLLVVLAPFANAIKSKADASSVYTKQQVDDAIDAITIPVDDTLSQTGEAADAKAVGDALSELNGSLDTVSGSLETISELLEHLDKGLTDTQKAALLACFRNVAWINADGEEYYDALEAALYDIQIVSISATYTPSSNVIYTDDSLDVLKEYTVVRATYATGVSAIVTDYTLSGTLSEGNNTVTISYRGKTTTITVSAVNFYNIRNWEVGTNMISINRLPGNYNSTLGLGNVATTRRALVTNHGVDSIKDNGAETNYYPIPIPSGCNTVKVNCQQSNYYYALPVWTYDSTTKKYTKLGDIGWATGETTNQITFANAMFVTVNIKNGSAGTADITVEPNITIQFS